MRKGFNSTNGSFHTQVTLNTLINFYSRFEESPKRIFVATDFGGNTIRNRLYFNTLIELGLVESVNAYVDKNRVRPSVIGYRLISGKKDGKRKK